MIVHENVDSYTLKPSTTTEVIEYCDNSSLSHKAIAVVFQLYGTDGSIIETKEAKTENLKESAYTYKEISEDEILYQSDNLVISYADIRNCGLYFYVKNNTDSFVKIAYDSIADSEKNGKSDSKPYEMWIPAKCIGYNIVACSEDDLEKGTSGQFCLTMYKEDTGEIIETVSISYADMKTKYDHLGINWN